MAETVERATLARAEPPVQHAVLQHISWDTYEKLLADHLDTRWPRFVYDEGTLEIMTPSSKHDRAGVCIQKIIAIIAEEWRINLVDAGHATMRRRDLQKGFESDASIYIKNARAVRPKEEIDLNTDPPPDLVVEVEVSRSALEKLGIYSRLGIPEVWRCDMETATFHILQGDHYMESSTSVALPGVTTQVLVDLVNASWKLESLDWIQAVREWARAHRRLEE